MTDPNVSARVEAELARFKAEAGRVGRPEIETVESRRAKVRPMIRTGLAVEAEIRSNLIVTAQELLALGQGGPAPREITKFDRVMRPWAKRFLRSQT